MFAHQSYCVAPNPDDSGGGGGGGGGGGSGHLPTGMILPYAVSTAPSGYLMCDGTYYQRTDHPRLYGVIGNTFVSGSGFNAIVQSGYVVSGLGVLSMNVATNPWISVGQILMLTDTTALTGSNINNLPFLVGFAPAIGSAGSVQGTFLGATPPAGSQLTNNFGNINLISFAVPDLRQRTVIGNGLRVSPITPFASTGGASTVVISADNLPQHTHQVYVQGNSTTTAGTGQPVGLPNTTNVNITTVPSRTLLNDGTTLATNSAVNIQNPYIALNYVIKD